MKITIIGAGSNVFAAELIKDVLLVPELDGGSFALVDIDSSRLEVTAKVARNLIERTGKRWSVESSTDRKTLLRGSDYIINSIEVAGPQNVMKEYEIPLKYGVDQCIGDTMGPGGLFKALRTLPSWLDILNDIETHAPKALVMNYTNPMSITVLCAHRATDLSVVGLCHSIQNTSRQIAEYLEIPYEKLTFKAAGTNHLAWFTLLEDEHRNDLYPLLGKRASNPRIREKDPVRFELMDHLGAFVTESSGHVSEYLPFIRKRPDIIEKVCGPGELGGSGYYVKTWPEERARGDELLSELKRNSRELTRGMEFASYIIEAKEHNKPTVVYVNVSNSGNLISNLPPDGVVEVPCLVDGRGIQPLHFGRLPTHLANFNQQHMAFHDLVVHSILHRDREAAEWALKIDPLTAAVCSLSEIRSMFEELLEAEKEYLPGYFFKE